MHLLFENLVPNMIAHWTGTFKKLDQGTGNYEFAPGVWDRIGVLTEQAARTIPAAFVGTIPNIARDQTLYKAEAYAFWWQYIGPIVLHGRLDQEYYEYVLCAINCPLIIANVLTHRHYLLGREIVIQCVQLQITNAEIDELEEMINRWVAEYERYVHFQTLYKY
jgi:hypothetical protein